jgi:DNA-binding NarL/FixJ family response regulator
MTSGGATLAVVHRHVTLRQGLELLLRDRGYVLVGSASTARAGYELVRRARPTAVLIDLDLPDESGAALTRRLLAELPELAVLLYAGLEDAEGLDDAIDSGARAFVSKSGALHELTHAIDVVVGGGEYVDPRLTSILLGRSTTERLSVLSPREREVLDLLARGMNGEEAAEALFLSPETVRTHIRNAMEKLDAHTRVRAVVLALREGLIGESPRGDE